MILTLIGENDSGVAPSQTDLQYWADSFGLTFPVLSDPGFYKGASYIPGGTINMPNYQLIGPGMEILAVDEWGSGISDATIEANLPD